MAHNLIFYNNSILHKKAEFIKKINDSVHKLIGEMSEVMKRANGIGIAAPQVGESIQLAIVDIPKDMGGTGRIILINPKIVSAYGSEVSEEGCLSVPGVQIKVKRYKEVTVEALDMDGKPVTYRGTGLFARVLQHEIDHLNGVLIIDKINPVRRVLIRRRCEKLINSQ